MSTTPQQKTDAAHSESSEALEPIIDPIETEAEGIANSYVEYAQLRDSQKAVLIGMMTDFLSETIRTDRELADSVGVSNKTVYNCKINPRFNRVMTAIMPELVKAKLPKYLSKIEKHGDKDFRALQLLLEYAGLYVKSSQNFNVNANLQVNESNVSSPTQASESFCKLFMGFGYDVDSLVELVRDTYTRLKSEGL